MSTLIHRRLNIIILNKKVVTSQLVVMARWWGWMDVEHLENEMCHGVMELPSHGHVILLHVTQVWPCMTVIYVSFPTKFGWQPAEQVLTVSNLRQIAASLTAHWNGAPSSVDPALQKL